MRGQGPYIITAVDWNGETRYLELMSVSHASFSGFRRSRRDATQWTNRRAAEREARQWRGRTDIAEIKVEPLERGSR